LQKPFLFFFGNAPREFHSIRPKTKRFKSELLETRLVIASTKTRDTTLTGWTTTVAANDFLFFHVDSCSSIKRLLVFLTIAVR
jgi:hypothetical protein